MAEQPSRACEASDREPFKRRLRLTSWPRPFSDVFKIFKHPNFDIQIGDLPNVQISPNLSGRQLRIQGATLLFGSTSKSQRIASYNFWDKFKFESTLNFKGIQTFPKKI
jgi:hypothetical protein